MDINLDRYSRQMRFPGIGEDGQKRLVNSHVTLCGCGALGTVVANAMVRAGVGHLRLIDRDFIETNNLQRQVLFDEHDVAENLPKAEAAARKLGAINSAVHVEPVVADIDRTNILELVQDADLILDGTDNFEIRYLINDVAVKLGKPWVYGGAIGSHGQTMTILPADTPYLRRASQAGPGTHRPGAPTWRPVRPCLRGAAQLRSHAPHPGAAGPGQHQPLPPEVPGRRLRVPRLPRWTSHHQGHRRRRQGADALCEVRRA